MVGMGLSDSMFINETIVPGEPGKARKQPTDVRWWFYSSLLHLFPDSHGCAILNSERVR